MKRIVLSGGLLLAMSSVIIACASASAPPLPTSPPPSMTPIPPSATPIPATATLPPPTATTNPHMAGADCQQCHAEEHKRWATTLHAADPAAVLLNEAHDKEELLVDECLACHTPFQAAKFHVGDFVQPLDQNGPWSIVEANVKAWEAIKCEVCHDPTSRTPHKLAYYDGTQQAYVSVKDTTELCEKCHQPGTDDSRDLKGSVHEGVQCAACHFQKGTEMSLDPHASCADCHPKANPKHPDVTQLDTTYKSAESKNDIHFLTCATCHPQGTPTPTR